MRSFHDTQELADCLCEYVDGSMPPRERSAFERQLRNSPEVREKVAKFKAMQRVLEGTFEGAALSESFAEDTGKRLRAVSEREDEEWQEERRPADWLTSVQRTVGAAPWWIISGAFHALLIMLVTLISLAILKTTDDRTVIVTDLARQKEPEEIEKKTRDVFKKPVPIENTEITEEAVVVTHEEVEIAEHLETADEADTAEAHGDDGISDVMLGGSGTVAALGLGGGGGGAFGRPTSPGGRLRRAVAGGGGRATESAVDAALRWLARNQEADGRWDSVKHGSTGPCDTAVTGFALLAFLGAGHTEKIGKYRDNVNRAVSFLIGSQRDNGLVLNQKDTYGHAGYNHAIAALALAESAAMARIAKTKAAAQKAVDYSIDIHQNGKGSERGAWRYSPKRSEDISVTGWFVMQLKSAKVAGLQVDPAAFDGATNFLDRVMVDKPKPGDPYSGHRYGYTPGKVKDPACNGAIGVLCRQFMGTPIEELKGGIEYFLGTQKGIPQWKFAHFYYWYYATLCCFQQGGDIWKRWNDALKPTLVENQCKGGDDDGSWEPKGPWVGKQRGGGRVMSTALGALCLEVYYRYLPMYRE